MITNRGSQVSMDLYPDMDLVLNFSYLQQHYAGVEKIFEKAQKHKHIQHEPSRLPHLRALCSPYFLMGKGVPKEHLFDMQDWALAYLEEWIKIYQAQGELEADGAALRLRRRQLIARTIIENDPDRDKVVDVYGEETTQAIEAAAML